MKRSLLVPEFVEFIPAEIAEGMLYVSMTYETAVHKCCCGCGQKVVTPFSPMDWKLNFDGDTVSLTPSIGNWSFACQSHYWIEHNAIRWAPRWSRQQIEAGRKRDQTERERYYGVDQVAECHSGQETTGKRDVLAKVRRWFASRF